MKKVRNNFNADHAVGEINDEASMTVPNMSMKIEDMLKRMAQGIPVDYVHAVYTDEEDPITVKDLTDIDRVEAKLSDLKAKMSKDVVEAVKREKVSKKASKDVENDNVDIT